ncbi:GntR family transcriptional regulator [Nonomuraea sp. PA05]|uniref:GntR family transcriptional regulator n=1 Tax=Nonomuraea sp. PA05 TaxID=2604466 RepID=UPI0011D3592B|nr:GntR family transcriptional regulator [Nonomuraea sp. PA05]TYB56821.1 GntR family transcriptional regulator [Nonomuraea sp. PA05]
MTERDTYKPMYLVIAEDLRTKIKSGELPPDAQVPSERALCATWACSAITARRALTELRNEGTIYTLRGKGAFVSSQKRPLIRVAPDRFQRTNNHVAAYRREAEKSGTDIKVDWETERTEAPAEVAERLGIDEGDPITETSYRISMGGEPVSMSLAWEPLAITAGTEIELPHEGPHAGKGIVPRFDAIGRHVDMEEEFLRARMPERHEIVQLKCPPGVPVIEIWQTFWAGDLAVEVAKIIFRADRYDFRYRMPIH